MAAPQGLRTRLRLRQRFRDPIAIKHDAELQWWLRAWEPVLQAGGFNPGDALAFLDAEQVEPTYLGRRWQQARAEVNRVLQEAAIDDIGFFEGKVVVDVGPGPLGFPDACPARVSIGVDPLAECYARHGLLLPGSTALYLSVGAERIPLLSESVDVVLARNSLDHVDDPETVLKEARRLLRPGGALIMLFDVNHTPTPTEPHALTASSVSAALEDMIIIRERTWDEPFGHDGHRVMLLAEKVT
jgi:SAM-dependent methyltransferase